MPIKNNGSMGIGKVFSVKKDESGIETRQEVKSVWNVIKNEAGVETRQLIWENYPKPPIAGASIWIDTNDQRNTIYNTFNSATGANAGVWQYAVSGNQSVHKVAGPNGYNCYYGNGYAKHVFYAGLPAQIDFTVFMCCTMQNDAGNLVQLMGGMGTGTGYQWRLARNTNGTFAFTTNNTHRASLGNALVPQGVYAARMQNPGFGSLQVEVWTDGNLGGYTYGGTLRPAGVSVFDSIWNFTPGSGLLGFQGHFYELLVYPRFLQPAEMSAVYNYLVKKCR